MVIVVMGPSGAGKTTVGRALAVALGWGFVEADDLHTPHSIDKMRRGEGLTDADREPWLQAVRQAIVTAVERREPLVVACSALKEQYRETLRHGLDEVRFVYLKAGRQLLRQRLSQRPAHFAGPALVDSQLATLEEPHGEALIVDAAAPVDAIVSAIRDNLL